MKHWAPANVTTVSVSQKYHVVPQLPLTAESVQMKCVSVCVWELVSSALREYLRVSDNPCWSPVEGFAALR